MLYEGLKTCPGANPTRRGGTSETSHQGSLDKWQSKWTTEKRLSAYTADYTLRGTGSSIAIPRTRTGHLNRSIVDHGENARLPKSREAHGNGVVVVVRVRESLIHDEGRQAGSGSSCEGKRNAESRHRETESTGEPGALKVASPVRGGAVGKGLVTVPRWPPTPHSSYLLWSPDCSCATASSSWSIYT
jgi:hypothetical protein